MDRRRFLQATVGTALSVSTAGCANQGDGAATSDEPTATETPAATTEARVAMPDLQFQSTAFDEGATIPEQYTCAGDDDSPPLSISGVSNDAERLAVIVDDPDAPGGAFTHWLLWNVPANVEEIPEALAPTETIEELDGARQGTNDFGEVGYRGPCPPEGDSPHTYRFRLYVLDEPVRIGAGAKKKALTDAIQDVRLATAEFTASFGR